MRGALKKNPAKVGLLDQPGGGLTESQLFWQNFPTKFALQLTINVMKHTRHIWGDNIPSIHKVIGPPTAILGKKRTGKVETKLGQFSS